jgi:hypothetical protein
VDVRLLLIGQVWKKVVCPTSYCVKKNACATLRKDVEINCEGQQMLCMCHLHHILLLVRRKTFHLVNRKCGIKL